MAPTTLEFNVNEDSYEEFIQRIRDELTHSTSHGIPVLRPQDLEAVGDERWLDILLIAGDNRITLRLERSNLYLRGYRRADEDFFWEFTADEGGRRVIDGSQDVGFSSSYIGGNSMGTRAATSVETVLLGRAQLENAVHNLANNREVARSLFVGAQMIPEAVRFRPIKEHIGDHYWDSNGVMLTSEMVGMVKGWARLSTAVLRLDPGSPLETPLPNISADNPAHVSTLSQATLALGILLIAACPRWGAGSRHKRVSLDDYGRCLMNLDYVRVNRIDGENPGNLFGTVKVDDGWFTYTFYDRTSADYEDVGPGELATLIDPSQSHAVSGADSFVVTVDLFDHNSLFPNRKIAQKEIVWDRSVESVTFANYDKHIHEIVEGDYGAVTVGYTVFSNARSVTIQVLLINGDGEDPAEVYGTVGAYQNIGGAADSSPMNLFVKSSDDWVEVGQGQPIPLIRKVIAASTSTNLTIEADLWDHDKLSPDDEIAHGRVTFTVQLGTQKLFINGQYGKVQVIITCE